MTAAATLKASLSIRIAPSTERSASRLCGSVRSERQLRRSRPWILNDAVDRKNKKAGRSFRLPGNLKRRDCDSGSRLTRPVTFTTVPAVTSRCSLTGTASLPERLDRIGQQDLAAIDVEALRLQQVGDVGVGDRPVELVVLADLAG